MAKKLISSKIPKICSSTPPTKYARSKRSFYRDFFETMKVNEWCSIPKEHEARWRNAANKYMRGRYSVQAHDNSDTLKVFTKIG